MRQGRDDCTGQRLQPVPRSYHREEEELPDQDAVVAVHLHHLAPFQPAALAATETEFFLIEFNFSEIAVTKHT